MISKVITLFFVSLLPLGAIEKGGFYELADSVLRGGSKYTLEEVKDVSKFTEIPIHHRAMIEVAMLGSIEDESRYMTAIAQATDYLESGTVGGAKDYLLMQRGFLYGLLGEREKGAKDLETIIKSGGLISLNSINDPILDIMRKRSRDLALELDSLMRQTVGNYYMDYRSEDTLPAEAFRYFHSIKSAAFRDKCLLELKLRLGNDTYEKLESTENSDPRSNSVNNPDKREIKIDRIGGIQEDRNRPEATLLLPAERKVQITSEMPESNSQFGYLGAGVLLGFILAILLRHFPSFYNKLMRK